MRQNTTSPRGDRATSPNRNARSRIRHRHRHRIRRRGRGRPRRRRAGIVQRPGARLLPAARGPARSLRRAHQDRAVPPRRRDPADPRRRLDLRCSRTAVHRRAAHHVHLRRIARPGDRRDRRLSA
ncbi:hypothetical protein G6015_06720, partial [Dietzia sp. SLG510A3-40A3]|nr:hypothetical protein [Dietzia sp. SLG510A3-40A3]